MLPLSFRWRRISMGELTQGHKQIICNRIPYFHTVGRKSMREEYIFAHDLRI